MFRAWVESDTPEGIKPETDESDDSSERLVEDEYGEPSFIAMSAEPYLPSDLEPDDYRCFQVGEAFAEDTFVKMTRIVPDAREIVHHVLLYVINPSDVAELEMRDAEEEGPGYTCFGGPGIGSSFGPIAGWVPGALPQITPEGSARYIPAGSKLVMQLHYNVLNSEITPDQTSVEFYTDEVAPEYEINTVPQPHLGIDVPAGDGNSVQVKTFPVNQPDLTVIAVTPHMHSIGKNIRLDLVRADGSEECIVDIPKWDFNWQQTYEFLEDEVLVAQPGDEFRLTCVYDNSEVNQPIVNGEQLEPRRVTWGDGTLDEMCLNYIVTTKPFMAAQPQCAGLSSCRMMCEDPNSFDCILECSATDSSCGQCLIPKMIQNGGCARDECGAELGAISGCFRSCVAQLLSGGDIGACFAETCPDEYQAFNGCMTPVITAGLCDEGLNSCIE
jgi:hypothetical protein